MKKILSFTALSMCAAPAFAQGADECAAAVALGTGPTTVVFDTNLCTDTGVAATTSLEQQCATLSVDVWFKYVAQTTGLASFDTCNNATFDTEIAVWEGSDCSTFVGLGCNDDAGALGCTGLTSFLTNIPVIAGQTYHIQLGHYSTGGGTWGGGTITINEFPDPCIVNTDDNFEDNDSCAAAVGLGAGANVGLYVSNTDADFYRITVPLGQVVDVALSNMVSGDADLRIFDANCVSIGGAETTGSFANLNGGGPLDVVFEVYMDVNAAVNCTDYDLTVTFTQDPCFNGTDDNLEDNDTCQTARPMMAGTNLGLYCSLSDSDFYSIVLQPGEMADFNCSNDLNADVDLSLFDANCTLIQSFNTDALSVSNVGSATPTTYIVEIWVDPTSANSCTNYDMDIIVTVDPCFSSIDDAFEDNDVCTSPTVIGAGTNLGLFAARGDADFYRITLQPNERVDFTVSNDTNADIDLNVYDSNCSFLLDSLTDTVSYSNIGGAAPITVVIEAFVDAVSANSCTNYDLDIAIGPDPCSLFQPDMFEENDDCSSARSIGDGLFPGLTLSEQDNDYYSVSLDAGMTLTVDIFFDDLQADVDLYLWDPLLDCDTNVAGTGGAYLVRGFSTSDDEQVVYTNTGSSALNLIIEVDMFSAGGCNAYDMQVMGAGSGVGPIGTNYCQANPNVTGLPGEMSAVGSTFAAVNDVTLMASSLPNNQFGIFVVGQSAAFVPNGGGTSNGNICIGGLVGRYNQAGQIFSTGTTGSFSLQINLNTIPQGNGNAMTLPGDTWFFQAWHRSGQGLGSNFTDGLEIGFN